MEKVVKSSPSLRFPEFREGWNEVSLGDEVEFYKGQGLPKGETFHGHQPGEIRCIRYGELYTTYNEVITTTISGTFTPPGKLFLSQAGDVIIPSSGETAYEISTAAAVMDSGIALGGDLNIIRSKDNGVFLSYYLNHRLKKQISNLAQGNSVVHLYSRQLSKLKIRLPNKTEQNKIADFFEAVDEKVELMRKRIDLLKKYKKGVMQAIFSQKIRFKDENGKSFPDWEEKKLGELGDFFRGLSYSSQNVKDKGLLVLRAGNIKNGILDFNNDLQFVDIISPEKIVLQKGDLVICMSSGSKALVGKTGEYIVDYDGVTTVGAFCSIFRTNSTLSKYLFQTQQYKKYLDIALSGTNINNLQNSDLVQMKFNFPSSEREQQKIADFLSTLDDKIDLEESKLEQAKHFKKALLQQMFV